jgi:hypothetical protein
MRGVLLDLNIALDIFLARKPWSTEAAAIWKANPEGRVVAYFASISVPTLFYVVRKQRGLALAQMAVADCLSSLTIITVALSTLRLAATGHRLRGQPPDRLSRGSRARCHRHPRPQGLRRFAHPGVIPR